MTFKPAREKASIDLRDDKHYTIQKQLLRSLIDKSVNIANDIFDNEERAIITGYLQGKSTRQIASELNLQYALAFYYFQEPLIVHLFICQILTIAEECVCCDRRGGVLCLRLALQMNGPERDALFLSLLS